MSVTSAQLEELRGFDTATIASAISKLGLRSPTMGFASGELRCQFTSLPPTVGFAVTCREDTSTPLSERGRSDADMFTAVAESVLPAVVVMQDVGLNRMRSCHLGDGMAMALQRLGAVGFVTDGAVRDIDGIRSNAQGFQVFAAGVVPSSGQPNLIDVGQPVEIFGMTVRSGDLVHGDQDGVLTVPIEHVPAIIKKAHEVMVYEKDRAQFLQSSEFTLEGWLTRYV